MLSIKLLTHLEGSKDIIELLAKKRNINILLIYLV